MPIGTESNTSTPWSGPAAWEEFLASRDEPAWVTDRRRDAWRIYQAAVAKPLDPEEYKRIDLRTFKPEQYHLAPAPAEEDAGSGFVTLMQDRADFAGRALHVDGHAQATVLRDDLRSRGVIYGDLAELLRGDLADRLAPHLMTTAMQPGTDRFSAWHAACWTGGTVFLVPRNVEISVPLHSLIALRTPHAADLSHTLIVLEEGASATLLEETCSAAHDEGLHVGAVELIVGGGAQLRYVQLQNWGDKVRHFAHQSGRVARDAKLQWTVAALGSRLAHIHQEVHLDGRGAEAEVNGVSFATDRQLLSYHTQQTHHEPNTRSDLLYKEVLRDRSRMVWRGMIKVDKAAQKTDGYQRNDALMLSADARADAIPGLEIEADDVRCTHGATAGRIDDEQVLYAMCRGLSRFEAMHLIVEGFFAEVYDRIPVELVRETLGQAVERKLGFGS